MAKDIEYWYDIIISEKNTMSNLSRLQPNVDNAQALLSDVTTTSKVARWRLWVWCVAVCAYAFYVTMELFKIELEDIASRSRYGTTPWYAYIAKSYQHGYELEWVNNQYEYATIDDSAKIIKRAAAVETLSTVSFVHLKVAKLVGSTVTPLSADEYAAFYAYVIIQKPPGVTVHVISDDPDDLQLYLKIKYDALVLTSTGESILNPGVFPVEDAINDYKDNLPFNGTLELCDLIDSVQKASGVISAYVTNAQARYGANPFIAFTERYVANAGHMQIDPAMPLSDTITYEANV